MASVINLVVRARDETMRGLNSASRGFNRFFRQLDRAAVVGMRSVGATMANGIGNGLRTAMSNPYVAAGVLAVAASLASMLGAALAAALVGVIGGAFVGLGVLIAVQSKNVKDKWAKTLKELKPLFEDAAQGMLPVIERARQQLTRVAKSFAPHFKAALVEAAPAVETFMDYIVKGFERLGKTAAGSLESGFRTLLGALGPMLEDTLAGMGDSLAALGRTVGNRATEISIALNGIIGLITTVIDIINFFAVAWSEGIRKGSAAVGHLIQALGVLVGAAFTAVDKILGAFSHLPIIGGQFKAAQQAMQTFKAKTVEDMQRLGQKFIDVGKNLDTMNRKRRLEVDIKSWDSKLATARALLKKTSNQKAKAKLEAEIGDLTRKTARARAELDRINGMVATTYIITHSKTYKSVHDIVKASGGNVGTAATGGARSNMVLVGEQGPELVDLPGGSHVRNNSDSRRFVRNDVGGGMGSPFVLLLDVGGSRLAELMIDPTRKIVKSRGGVRATFGDL